MPSLRRLQIGSVITGDYDACLFFPENKYRTSSATGFCINHSFHGIYGQSVLELESYNCRTARTLQRIIVDADLHDHDEDVFWDLPGDNFQIIEKAINRHFDTLTDLFLVGLVPRGHLFVGPFPHQSEDAVLNLINCRSLRKLAIPDHYLAWTIDDSKTFDARKRFPGSLEQLRLEFDAEADCEETYRTIGRLG